MAGGPLKVIVVDGHPVVAEALALAIDATGELSCVGTACDADEALALAEKTCPDVAVMDIQPDKADRVLGTRRLLERHPGIRVLVLTGLQLSPSLVRDVADSGACGVLPKSASLGAVVETIPSLRSPCFTLDRASLRALVVAPGAASGRRGAGASLLTNREQDILTLLVSGVDLQRASVRLGITVNTARGYVKNLYRKLGVHNQLELLAVARERGLLDEDSARAGPGAAAGFPLVP